MPFEENEPSDAFHIVIAGCLGVVGRTSAGADELIGRVRTGETIGELELPGGRPRAMTVVALRDTSLLRVTKLACETLSQRDPRAMLQLIVQFFARLQWPRRPGIALQAPNNVALTRLGATVFIAVVAQSLARHVTAPGFTANVIDAGTTDSERTYAIPKAAHSLAIYQGETQIRAGCSCVCGVPVAYCSSRTRPSGRRGIPRRSSTVQIRAGNRTRAGRRWHGHRHRDLLEAGYESRQMASTQFVRGKWYERIQSKNQLPSEVLRGRWQSSQLCAHPASGYPFCCLRERRRPLGHLMLQARHRDQHALAPPSVGVVS